MQQRVLAPGDFYEPNPFAQTSKAPPPPPPSDASWLEEIGASFRSAATADEAPVREREAIDNAFGGVVDDLARYGVDTKVLRRRDPRAGFALTYDESGIWKAVEAVRQRDAKAFAGLPATVEQFREKALTPLRGSIAKDAEVAAQSGWSSWLLGSLGYGAADPLNTATLPLGIGATRSIGQAVLQGAKLNAGIEAVAVPSRAIERGAQGRTLSTGEAVTGIAVAGVAGGVLTGLGKALEGVAAPRSAVAAEARETIGVDRMTELERGAADAADRDAEVDATNPFGAGAGAVAHATRLDAEISAILNRVEARNAPAPTIARPAAGRAAPIGGDAQLTFKSKVRRAESGGNDAARNPKSTATGRFQFTRGTWLTYHKKVVGGQMSDDARWAQATDGVLQERLMDALTADNARYLAKIGARETPGNLYLVHFAGQGGARKILQAAPDTPIEQLLTADAINANAFLRGKTAGDVVEWTHAKMGGDPDVPVLPRDRYTSDEQWASAQREVDAAEAELRAADAELARAAQGDGPEIVPPLERYTAIERDAELVGMNWDPIVIDRPSFERVVDPYTPPKGLPRRTRPSDVIEFLADRGGVRDDAGHDLAKGRGLSRLTVPPLIRKNGMDIDRAGEMLWEGGYFVTRPSEAQVLDLIDEAAFARANGGRRRYSLTDQEEMDYRADRIAADERFVDDVRRTMDADEYFDFDGGDADMLDDIVSAVAGGRDPWAALDDVVAARRASVLDQVQQEVDDNGWNDVFPDDWIPGFGDELGSRAAAEGAAGGGGRSALFGGNARERGGDAGAGGEVRGGEGEATAARAAVAPFDDPIGSGAVRQSDSLAHDLRMALVLPAPDTRGEGVFYHGARGEVPDLSEGYYNPANIYGGFDTFYTTDAVDIGMGYSRKQASGRVYRVVEKRSTNLFDMEEQRSSADWYKLFGYGAAEDGLVPMAVNEVARAGKANLREIMDAVREFSRDEGYSRDDVQEVFSAMIYTLQEQGFDGMSHIGGLKTGRKPHNVRIYFDAHDKIDLIDVSANPYKAIDRAGGSNGPTDVGRKTDSAEPDPREPEGTASAEGSGQGRIDEGPGQIDPGVAVRQRQEAGLRAAAPMQAKVDQDSMIGSPLFDAVDQMTFRLDDGEPVDLRTLLDGIVQDEASITAARGCMVPPAAL